MSCLDTSEREHGQTELALPMKAYLDDISVKNGTLFWVQKFNLSPFFDDAYHVRNKK